MKRNPLISALEPRVLFDGAAVATAVDVLDNNSFENNDTPDTTPQENKSKEIVFIDSQVENKEEILKQLYENTEVYILDDKSDVLEQIETILEDKNDIDTLHIISHGKEGELLFSSGSINSQNIQDYEQTLKNISNSLSKEADILLYGCSIGQNNQGKDFVDKISSLTSADVAASDDLTGDKLLNGDWNLEYKSGVIESQAISIDNYETLLANDAPYLSTSTNYDSIPASDFSDNSASFAFDNDVNTSFSFPLGSGTSFDFDALNPYIVNSFAITTSTGSDDLDPIKFAIYGSNDRSDFSSNLIVSMDINPSTNRGEEVKVEFSNTEVFRYYRVEFNKIRGGGAGEVAEIKLGGMDITTFTYTEDGPSSELVNLVILTDDGADLQSAQISITSGFTSGDMLEFNNDDNTLYGNILSSYDSSSGVLNLSGTATVEQYKNALKAIRFYSTNDSPETAFNQRTLSWKVNDGVNDSNISKTVLEIIGVNDTPIIDNADDNSNLVENGTISASGDIDVSDKDLNDTLSASYISNSFEAYESDGVTPLSLTQTQQNEIINSFDFTNSSINSNTGTFSWSYAISNNKLDFLANNESVIVKYTIQITDNSGASVNQVITINIQGVNDTVSVNSSTSTGEIVDKGVVSQNGVIAFVDEDTTDKISASLVSTSLNGYNLSSQEEQVILDAFSFTNANPNSNTGSINWDFTISQSDIEFLGTAEVITAVFTIEVNDNNGGVRQQDITIQIKGTNDKPSIQVIDDEGRVSEGSTLSDSGKISFSDIDKTDQPSISESLINIQAVDSTGNTISISGSNQAILENAFSITQLTPNSNSSEIQWDYSLTESQLDFLSQGDKVTLTFQIRVQDAQGEFETHDITILIVGENDIPLITAVDVEGQIQEGSTLSDSGSIDFSDIDKDDKPLGSFDVKDVVAKDSNNQDFTLSTTQRDAIKNAFSITNLSSNTNTGTITWDYSISEGDINFLAQGETVTAIFTITVTDNDGQTSTQDVKIVIQGANDTPTITGSDITGTIQESSTYNDTGTINFNDLDLNDSISISDYFDSITAYRADGITTFNLTTQQEIDLLNAFSISSVGEGTSSGTITWDYTISEAQLDFLAENELIRITYNIEITDSQNQKDMQTITIDIGGQNDAPIVSNDNIDSIITYGQDYSQEISFLFTDVDKSDNLVYEATGLPTGINYDLITGLISGRPLEIGIFEVTITTYDSSSMQALASRTYQIDVLGPPKVVVPEFEPPKEVEPPIQVDKVEISDNSQKVEQIGVIKSNTIEEQENSKFNQDFQKLDTLAKGYTDFKTVDETQVFTNINKFNILKSIDITLGTRGEVDFQVQQKEAYETLGLTIEDFSYVSDYMQLKIVDIKQARAYEVLMVNGDKLPITIVFDEKTGLLKGLLKDNMEFSIKAYDFDNKIRILNIKIDISALKEEAIEITSSHINNDFSSQVTSQSNQMQTYGKNLAQLFSSKDT